MKIQIKNLQKTLKIRRTPLKAIVQEIADFLDLDRESTLSLVIVDEARIRDINNRYFHNNQPTDVICFNLKDKFDPCATFGEIIISTQAAIENSKLFSTKIQDEFTLYLIHGLLHLVGFKDKTTLQKKKMQKKEKIILNFIQQNKKSFLPSLIV